jgi:hypothetical protein
MKREFLKDLGLSDEQIDKIMAENGKDVEAQKTKTTTAEAERDGLKQQLTEANTAIDGFKALNVDQIKASVDEWKTKAEKAQSDAAAQVAQLRFDHALDGALTTAKAKNAKAVKALLDMNGLKLNEADGSIVGLEDQLKKVRESADYLFESDKPQPQIVAGGGNQTVHLDPVTLSMRKAAGLKTE